MIEQLKASKKDDVDWRHGRSWSLVYYEGDEHTDFLKEVHNLYFSENAAGPALFPSLRRMEAEVVAMVLDLLGATGNEAGTMTSGIKGKTWSSCYYKMSGRIICMALCINIRGFNFEVQRLTKSWY